MKANLNLIYFFILFILYTQIQANDYIWINYLTKMPLNSLGNGTCSVNIPCEAKIGKCKIQYTLLPYGWAAASNGTIIFPQADTKKIGGYTIKATLVSIFGDQIQADLIGIIQNNALSVTDRSQFFKSNGFNQKQSVSRPMQMSKTYQLKKDYSIQGFPTLSQIQNLINTGNIYTVSSKLKDISDKYGPCQDRLSYLKQILKTLQNKIANNQNIISQFQAEATNLSQNVASLQNQKNQIQNKINSDKSFNDIKSRKKNLQASKAQLSTNFTKLDFLANRYLSNMNQLGAKPSPPKGNQTQQLQITQMEEQVKKLQQTINQAIQKKKVLQEQITKKKKASQQKQSKSVSSVSNSQSQVELMKLYQSKYREYSNQALDAKIKLMGVQQQIKSVNNKYNLMSSNINDIDKKITEAKQKLTNKKSQSSMQKQQQQINNNQIFKLSAKNMENKINLLMNSQCGYL